jgi:FecR protein
MKPEFDHARDVLGDGPGAARRALQRSRVLQQAAARRSGWRGLGWAAAGVAVLAAVLVVLVGRSTATDEAHSGDALTVAPRTAPKVLHFQHGSELTLAADSAAKVVALDAAQAEVVLEHGRLDAHVQKGAGRTWRYHAGPWVVRVVGTVLHVQWAPAGEVLEVGVDEGAVEVSREGQAPTLVRQGEVLRRAAPVREPMPNPVVEEAPPAPPQVPPAPLRRGAPPPPPVVIEQPVPPAAKVTWQTLLAAGDRRAALALVEADNLTDQLSDAEALSLADAARLERRNEMAHALLARVLGHAGADAAEAAFLLGRLEADAHAPGSARVFFARSLELDGSGPFSEQARGRLLEALLEVDDRPAAKKVAHDYLAQHPSGAWARLAQKIESAP